MSLAKVSLVLVRFWQWLLSYPLPWCLFLSTASPAHLLRIALLLCHQLLCRVSCFLMLHRSRSKRSGVTRFETRWLDIPCFQLRWVWSKVAFCDRIKTRVTEYPLGVSTQIDWVPTWCEYPLGFVLVMSSILPCQSCPISHATSVVPHHTCMCQCVHDSCLAQATLVHFYTVQYMWKAHVSMRLMHASMCHPQASCEFLHVSVHIQRCMSGSTWVQVWIRISCKLIL